MQQSSVCLPIRFYLRLHRWRTALNHTANKNFEIEMSTTKRVVAIRSYSIGELSKLYTMSVKTMNRWLKPHVRIIGKREGRYYTVKQVTAIFELIGLPKDFDEAA
jgi:hypothetical protein